MTARRRWLLAALCCLPFLVPDAKAGTHASLPPVGPYPDAPCNLSARMDIYVAPDGDLWECICEALKTGHTCDWYNHGAGNSAAEQRRIKRLHPKWRVHVVHIYPKAVAL
jgi:hypothetical protein